MVGRGNSPFLNANSPLVHVRVPELYGVTIERQPTDTFRNFSPGAHVHQQTVNKHVCRAHMDSRPYYKVTSKRFHLSCSTLMVGTFHFSLQANVLRRICDCLLHPRCSPINLIINNYKPDRKYSLIKKCFSTICRKFQGPPKGFQMKFAKCCW